tara:strand:+ start:402 stop:917 length:516 start_codon:yes stop_codon:yes gene_type:complete
MNKFFRKFILFSSFLLVPFITFSQLSFLSIKGIGPDWALLWLLPFALEFGPLWGLICGLSLGLMLDSFSIGGSSHIPALILLGIWWGYLGKKFPSIDLSLNLGLFAWLGSVIFGLTFWIQIFFLHPLTELTWFHSWAIQTLLIKAFITGLVAPIVCSWLLLIWRNNKQKYS